MSRRIQFALAVVGALALVGCSRPDIAPPQAGIAVPSEWQETDLAPTSLDLVSYWRLLDDPLITEFVELAAVNNKDLAQSAARLEQAAPALEVLVGDPTYQLVRDYVDVEEVDRLEAAGNYVKLHVGTESHLFRETMNAIESQLDADNFFRIHRSHIVNIERVKELQPWFNGEYVVFLKSGTRLTLSRGYREKLQDRIGRSL